MPAYAATLLIDVPSSSSNVDVPVWPTRIASAAAKAVTFTPSSIAPDGLSTAFNFGPDPASIWSVGELVTLAATAWKGGRWEHVPSGGGHEARLLALDSSRARAELGWSPVLGVREAVEWTTRWYRTRFDGGDVAALAAEQIAEYEARAERTWRAPAVHA